MQNRIDRLEGLVLSLMTNGASSAGPAAAAAAVNRSHSDSAASSFPPDLDQDDDDMIKEEGDEDSDVDGVADSLGIMKVDTDKGKTTYLGDSHWHLVLKDVCCSLHFFLRFVLPSRTLWTNANLQICKPASRQSNLCNYLFGHDFRYWAISSILFPILVLRSCSLQV